MIETVIRETKFGFCAESPLETETKASGRTEMRSDECAFLSCE